MTNGVKEVALVELPPKAIAVSPVETFERLARDPEMNVEKLERLMQMYERTQARFAEEQFNAAMSAAQTRMRPIAADAENPQTRSTYASYAALDRALRPIYTDHGFGVSFDTADSALVDYVRVVAYVTHAGGHARTYHVDMPADGKGARGGDVMTKTHAAGAAMSYGMRYLQRMIWNVAVGEDDRDGNAPRDTPTAPDGYADWRINLDACADTGRDALNEMWAKSNRAYRDHLQKAEPKAVDGLRARAAKAVKK